MTKNSYPYLSVQEHNDSWEFYVTVKPGKRIYLQGISQNKLARLRKMSAANMYEDRLQALALGFGARTKAEYARRFYKNVFGNDAVLNSRLP